MNRLALGLLGLVLVVAAVAGVLLVSRGNNTGRGSSSGASTGTSPVSVPTSPVTTTGTGSSPKPQDHPQLGVDVWWSNEPNRDTLAFDASQSADIVKYLVDDLHANAVTLCFPIYTDSVTSDTVFTAAATPSVGEVRVFVSLAESSHLRVAIRPLLNIGTLAYSWRGKIQPANLHDFFTSYANVLQPYLALATAEHVPTFVYAPEFWSLSNKRQYTPEWSYLVGLLSQSYHGQLEYDSSGVPYRLQQNKVPGYDDYTDAYFQVDAGPAATTETLYEAWVRLLQPLPAQVLQHTVFQEVGFATRPDGYLFPARVVSGQTDPSYLYMQKRWFTMVCDVAHHFHIAGLYFWTIYFNVDPLIVPPIASADPTTWTNRPGASEIASCFQSFAR